MKDAIPVTCEKCGMLGVIRNSQLLEWKNKHKEICRICRGEKVTEAYCPKCKEFHKIDEKISNHEQGK